MNIISINIREWCGSHCGIVDKDDCDKLRELADRIDREMVELPKDADGEPIRINDVVYGNSGIALTVVGLLMSKRGWRIDLSDIPFYSIPGKLTHKESEPDDSWEKLKEDAKRLTCDYAHAPRVGCGIPKCDGCRFQGSESCHDEMMLDIIARAKKLAGIEEEATK